MSKIACLLGIHDYGTFHNICIDPQLQDEPFYNIYSSQRTCARCRKTARFQRKVNKRNIMICTKWRKV